MKQYSAKLLFQFRVRIGTEDGKKRLCEERVVLISATSGVAALKKAKQKGKAEEHDYKNSEGNRVYFECVGVMELLCLSTVSSEGEVWYEIKERLLPMERKHELIMPESELNAIRNNE